MPDRNSQIGQLLIIGFDGTEVSPRLASLLTRIQPSGVILFARNISGAAQTHSLLRECQKLVATPLFTCVDLEGGSVDRFREVVGASPSPAEVFATGRRALFRKQGRIIGENCRALGFNVDFAPVLDLAFAPSRKVMSSRAVSDDPKQVAIYAREFLLGLKDARVLGCGKHFPGLGEGRLDSHHELPVIEKPLKRILAEDLAPYRLLRNQLPFVMVSHAAYPEVTRERTPASLSKKWISEILRKKFRYHGLVVSDDLEMGAVMEFAPIEETAVQHIRAGGDLALVCHKEEMVWRAYEALVREAERDRKFALRAAEAAARVLRLRKKFFSAYRYSISSSPTLAKTEKLTRQLWEFGEEIRLAAIPREGDPFSGVRTPTTETRRHGELQHRPSKRERA